ncbi:MAG: hypothetical protein DHS20C13_25540 [Thermodesulfobacteriota bacterium]|nr:MAG: hypothetical protein DHS20C13_25540 [Thermodesulfobacteriota bacterium]
MQKFIRLSFIALVLIVGVSAANSQEERYKYVIEESFYVVKPENTEKFVQVYREKLFPFWSEMQKRGIIVGEYKLYSQRLHTLDPHWTYKTVVVFPNYAALDKWLELRDEVYDRLFPGEGGYKAPRKEIDAITVSHWDEFIREIPLQK